MKNIFKTQTLYLIPEIGVPGTGIVSEADENLARKILHTFSSSTPVDLVISSTDKCALQTAQIALDDIAKHDEESPALLLAPDEDRTGSEEYNWIVNKVRQENHFPDKLHFSEILLGPANSYIWEKVNEAIISCKGIVEDCENVKHLAIVADAVILHGILEFLREEGDEIPDNAEELMGPGSYIKIEYDKDFFEWAQVSLKKAA